MSIGHIFAETFCGQRMSAELRINACCRADHWLLVSHDTPECLLSTLLNKAINWCSSVLFTMERSINDECLRFSSPNTPKGVVITNISRFSIPRRLRFPWRITPSPTPAMELMLKPTSIRGFIEIDGAVSCWIQQVAHPSNLVHSAKYHVEVEEMISD